MPKGNDLRGLSVVENSMFPIDSFYITQPAQPTIDIALYNHYNLDTGKVTVYVDGSKSSDRSPVGYMTAVTFTPDSAMTEQNVTTDTTVWQVGYPGQCSFHVFDGVYEVHAWGFTPEHPGKLSPVSESLRFRYTHPNKFLILD